jgi:hypothetical protein
MVVVSKSTCERKIRYGRQVSAENALAKMKEKYNDPFLEAYKCRHCDGFHLGHREQVIKLTGPDGCLTVNSWADVLKWIVRQK